MGTVRDGLSGRGLSSLFLGSFGVLFGFSSKQGWLLRFFLPPLPWFFFFLLIVSCVGLGVPCVLITHGNGH